MRRFFILGSKLLGIWIFLWAIGSSVSIINILSYGHYALNTSAVLIILSFSIILLFVAFLLLFRTEKVADVLKVQQDGELILPPSNGLLRTGIMLIGIYLLADSFAGTGTEIVNLFIVIITAIRESPHHSQWIQYPTLRRLIYSILLLILSLILTFRPDYVIELIKKYEKKKEPTFTDDTISNI